MSKIRNNESLIAACSERKIKFMFFWGHTVPKDGSTSKTCFSQWYPAPFQIDESVYPTAEHYMMAQKARLFNDRETLSKILSSTHPKQAKQFGRTVAGFDDVKWNEKRFEIVVAGNLEKFRQNEKLKAFLLGTGERVIVEASPVDKIWGIGLAQDDPRVESPEQWQGLNLLGYALMEVRDRLSV